MWFVMHRKAGRITPPTLPSSSSPPLICKNPRWLNKGLFRCLDGPCDNPETISVPAVEECGLSRLIHLHPGETNDPLELSIVPTDLKTDYEALSWCWGDEHATETVLVKDAAVLQSSVKVKPTIRKALAALRDQVAIRHLWIDTICINQQDSDEKSAQVTKMATIFSCAKCVVIWLELPSPQHTISLVRNSATIQDLKEIMKRRYQTSANQETRSHLRDLLVCKWFGRRWIIQEVTLAQRAILVAADGLGRAHSAEWADMCRVIRLLHEYHEDLVADKPTSDYDPDIGLTTEAFYQSNAHNLVRLIDGEFVEGTHRQTRSVVGLHPLEDLLTMCTSFRCQEGQDTVYALQQFAKPSSRIDVDYKKTALEVYKDMITGAIEASGGSIDIILRYWALWKMDISWIRFRRSTNHSTIDDQHREIRQRDLTGTAEAPLFRASGSSRVPCLTTLFRGPTSLILDAFTLDSIASTLCANPDAISNGWPKFAGWMDTTQDPPDHFWKTLVAGLDENGSTVSTPYKRLCGCAFFKGSHFRLFSNTTDGVVLELKRVFSEDSNSRLTPGERWERFNFAVRHPDQQIKIVDKGGKPEVQFSDAIIKLIRGILRQIDQNAMAEVARYRRLVLSTVIGRQLFKSSGLSLFGLAPREACAGDRICIIRGCSVPVAIREMSGYYKIIGECFVHGMMDGEAMDLGRAWQQIRIE
ncbi:heterokaryon incompatibility protein-domain-containing protein [Dactylonectria macrodidyma]|uniref:Heterokaryon incompatibility protein-domain-containing protein n=1 Tax=Dactylonectria macrodidyma TaxID=307937 RepID=A0A9P9DQ02_9HYPO|nr:heterokaryon incompatibility protein-domain-containing protein [Dactylonectria macrodidyma]